MYQKAFERIELSPMRSRRKSNRISCNLCGSCFHPNVGFERFCRRCKNYEELLKFSEWLPEFEETVTAKISA